MFETSLSGRTALVTGASRGIGRAVACRFASMGADIVGTYREDEASAKSLVEELEGRDTRVRMLKSDLGSTEGIESLVQALSDTGVDILVNNAGTIYRPGGWDAIPVHAIFATLTQHLVAPMLLIREIAPGMRSRGYGRIINMTSTYGLTGAAAVAAYTASKAGVVSLTYSLARELGSDGVTVNAIAPGNIDTDLTRGAGQEVIDWSVSTTPVGRLGTVDEIADASQYLVSSSFVNGHVLIVDGGQILNM